MFPTRFSLVEILLYLSRESILYQVSCKMKPGLRLTVLCLIAQTGTPSRVPTSLAKAKARAGAGGRGCSRAACIPSTRRAFVRAMEPRALASAMICYDS